MQRRGLTIICALALLGLEAGAVGSSHAGRFFKLSSGGGAAGKQRFAAHAYGVVATGPQNLTNAQKRALSVATAPGKQVLVSDGFILVGAGDDDGFYAVSGTNLGKEKYTRYPAPAPGGDIQWYNIGSPVWRNNATNFSADDTAHFWDVTDLASGDAPASVVFHPAAQTYYGGGDPANEGAWVFDGQGIFVVQLPAAVATGNIENYQGLYSALPQGDYDVTFDAAVHNSTGLGGGGSQMAVVGASAAISIVSDACLTAPWDDNCLSQMLGATDADFDGSMSMAFDANAHGSHSESRLAFSVNNSEAQMISWQISTNNGCSVDAGGTLIFTLTGGGGPPPANP